MNWQMPAACPLSALLSIIYNGDFKDYLDELERYEVLNPALNHLSKLQ